MGIKDELLKFMSKFKKNAVEDTTGKVDSVDEVSDLDDKVDSVDEVSDLDDKVDSTDEVVDLDDKVDEFINWYYENMVKNYYIDFGQYNELRRMRNLIEKIAVWYELRYPEYEVNRLMYCSGQELTNISDVMFKKNPYVNDLLDENSDAKELDWDEFYNVNAFIKSLPWDERYKFDKPIYIDVVYIKPEVLSAHLHLSKDGIVTTAVDISDWTDGVIKDEELEGLHIKEVVELFKERDIKLPENNELEKAIQRVDNRLYQREEMLNCAMYRIIDRGGIRIGPRRAFLFAKEFGRNIDIPMMYAVDFIDPGLRLFMNEYIKAGGSKDLKCYVGYFSRTSKKDKLDTVSVQDLILKKDNNAVTFYTPEEDELHQRLVNALASQVDQEAVKQEEVKKLRLERKLVKNRINRASRDY